MSDHDTIGIIQARMSSTRLPGKVLMSIRGKPMLHHLVERLRPAHRVSRWIVATSEDASDLPIADWCASAGIACFRGSLHDVLDRYYRCALAWRPAAVVRVTADCPLHHHAVVDQLVEIFWHAGVDYATNSFPPLYEDGFDTEVMRFACLEQAWRTARQPSEREHVTPAIRSDERLRRCWHKLVPAYDDKLSVDTAADLARVTRIFEALAPHHPMFTMHDVIQLIRDHTALASQGHAAAVQP